MKLVLAKKILFLSLLDLFNFYFYKKKIFSFGWFYRFSRFFNQTYVEKFYKTFVYVGHVSSMVLALVLRKTAPYETDSPAVSTNPSVQKEHLSRLRFSWSLFSQRGNKDKSFLVKRKALKVEGSWNDQWSRYSRNSWRKIAFILPFLYIVFDSCYFPLLFRSLLY